MKIILFSGGITLGSVSPLLSVIQQIKKDRPDLKCVWVGTANGPEKILMKANDVPFFTIKASKFRRYLSVKNFFDIFNFGLALFQSFYLLKKIKPACLVSAGSSISVPLHFVAAFLKIPTIIHQQDVRVGLANTLMAGKASKITVALEKSLDDFPREKTAVIGNPVREEILGAVSKESARKEFGIGAGDKAILFLGGGTGAMQINRLVEKTVGDIAQFAHIIHVTGQEKYKDAAELAKKYTKYDPYDFLSGKMVAAYAAADIVVCRAGFATLTELAALGLPAVLIPIRGTHQEDNAKYFADRSAAVLLTDKELVRSHFVQEIHDLLKDDSRLRVLTASIKNILPGAKEAATKFLNVIEDVIRKNQS